MIKLECRYRRLFAAYPSDFRDLHEDEMVSTLLDLARPGQQRPDTKEAAAIVLVGVQHRFRSAKELQHGLRLAGVAAVGLVTTLGLAALRIAALRPIEASATAPLLGWVFVACALVAGCRNYGNHHRIIPPAIASVLILITGSDVMGMRRSFLVPVALLLLLSTLAASASLRTRSLAAVAGAAAGVAVSQQFVHELGASFPPDVVPWEVVDRWELAQSIAELPIWLYFGSLAVALLSGLLRPRIAIAATVLAIPLAMLTTTRLLHLEIHAGIAPVAAILIVGTAGLVRVTKRSRLADTNNTVG